MRRAAEIIWFYGLVRARRVLGWNGIHITQEKEEEQKQEEKIKSIIIRRGNGKQKSIKHRRSKVNGKLEWYGRLFINHQIFEIVENRW